MPRPVITGVNDIATLAPWLVKEWDYEKNGGLTPERVSAKTTTKYYWKCSNGHSWKAAAGSRYKGNSCPYCTNQKILYGYNDLETLCPEIASEWNYERNGDLTPREVGAGSYKKVWWKCKNGHEWQAVIVSRNNGRGCAYCSKKRILAGYNDFETLYPDIALEWNYDKNGDLKPSMVMPASKKNVWWRCPNGHEYETSVSVRARGHKCPYCTHQKPIIGETDFLSNYPELAKEWAYVENNGKRPEDYTAVSGQKVYWRCPKNHIYQTTIAHRVDGNGCPVCAGKKIIAGDNDLQTLYPEIAKEWDYNKNELKPTEVGPGTNKKVFWICPLGHSYESIIYSRVTGTDCPYCAGRKVLVGFNDLAHVCPEIINEWDFEKNNKYTPYNVTKGSHYKVWWKCKNGHSWKAEIKSRISGNGCPVCSQSHLEKMVEKWLDENGYEYKSQVTFKDLTGYGDGRLSYDFGVKEKGKYKYLIECQGIQHYESIDFFGGDEQFAKQQLHDELKKEYAEKRGIKLIEVPYTLEDYESVANILDKNIKKK